MIVDKDLFLVASNNPCELFEIAVWAGKVVDRFVIGTDASKKNGLKLLEEMVEDYARGLAELFEEIYSIYGFSPVVVGKMRGRPSYF